MSIVYEEQLDLAYDRLLIPLGSTVIGNLTSRSDTNDLYQLRLTQPTLVEVKFSVEQEVTSYDYYKVSTPVGDFYAHPSFPSIQGGVRFLLPGGLGREGFNAWTFSVSGSNQGVFRGTYTLEISEIELEDGLIFEDGTNRALDSAMSVPLSGSISGWQDYSYNAYFNSTLLAREAGLVYGAGRENHFKFSIPVGEKGDVTITLNDDSQTWGSVAAKTTVNMNLKNEGGRELQQAQINENDSVVFKDLTYGTYYLSVDARAIYDSTKGLALEDGRTFLSSVSASKTLEAPMYFSMDMRFQSQIPGSPYAPVDRESANDIPPDSSVTTGKDVGDSVNAVSSLDVIVSLFGDVLYLKGLVERKVDNSHTIEYSGQTFNFADIDPFITTVVRDGEFTEEFAKEIADTYPEVTGISYTTAVTLVGASAIEDVLIAIAGADGNYVG